MPAHMPHPIPPPIFINRPQFTSRRGARHNNVLLDQSNAVVNDDSVQNSVILLNHEAICVESPQEDTFNSVIMEYPKLFQANEVLFTPIHTLRSVSNKRGKKRKNLSIHPILEPLNESKIKCEEPLNKGINQEFKNYLSQQSPHTVSMMGNFSSNHTPQNSPKYEGIYSIYTILLLI